MAEFVHLHVHSEYSLLDGACKITDIPARVKECGQNAVAITDHGVMYGVVAFYNACVENGIKPIIGCEVYVAPGSRFDKNHGVNSAYNHLVLLVKNETGYKNLIYLVSKGFTEGFYSKPRIDTELLLSHNEGLIALSACLSGYIPSMILSENYTEAERYALKLKEIFGDDFYLEIQNHGLNEEEKVISGICEIAKRNGIPLVATNDAHYLRAKDADAQNILTCIQTNTVISEGSPLGFQTKEYYLKNNDEMSQIFSKYEGAVENTVKIAEKCDFKFSFDKHFLPRYTVPKGTPGEYLRELTEQGIQKRLADGTLVFDYVYTESDYRKRAEYELSIIIDMGYAEYYLIVRDFIIYAKENGIPVGPGRGSGAGSLVAFLVGITDVDSIRFGLFFERFLNPERKSMPDFDTDFCYDRRQEVIDYVGRKYGEDRISQIVTFGTMAARAVVRDVGRAFGMPYAEVDAVAKFIPQKPNVTLKEALENISGLRALYENEGKIKKLIDTSLLLEGMPRHASTHAAGVVITDKPICEYVPVSVNGGTVVTQYDMDTIASIGLLKFDFLGLRYLTVISDTEKIIRKTEPDFDIKKIPLDDAKTFAMIGNGKTEGTFQLESRGMRAVLTKFKPKSIKEIMAIISLYRPGPMDSIPQYIENRENPEKITYTVPELKPILDETFGCIVYQEQVMQIFRDVAGYTLGKGYMIIKAISKKKAEVISGERKNFIDGARAHSGVDTDAADELFSRMESFAGYAFNKSHAAAYSILSYRTAYLKAHYPKEYFASLLASLAGNYTKIAEYFGVCRSLNIRILPPDINESGTNFTVCKEGIRCGLLCIKNVGTNFVKAILTESAYSPFKSFDDFISRMAMTDLNKRMVEALIKSGAFDSLGRNRSVLLQIYEYMIDCETKRHHEDVYGQLDLFSSMQGEDNADEKAQIVYEYPQKEELPLKYLLAFEKEFLGVYLSAHILDGYSKAEQSFAHEKLSDILEAGEGDDTLSDKQKVNAVGIVGAVRERVTKKGEKMAVFTLEDRYAELEVLVFPKAYSKCASCLNEGKAVAVRGSILLRDDEQPKITAEQIKLLPDNAEFDARGIINNQTIVANKEPSATVALPDKINTVYIRVPDMNGKKFEKALNMVKIFEGQTKVLFYDESNKKYFSDENLRMDVLAGPVRYLKDLLGEENVVVK